MESTSPWAGGDPQRGEADIGKNRPWFITSGDLREHLARSSMGDADCNRPASPPQILSLEAVPFKGGRSVRMTLTLLNSGWGGIRTHEPLSRLPVFKTGAFNRSATHPSTQPARPLNQTTRAISKAYPRTGAAHRPHTRPPLTPAARFPRFSASETTPTNPSPTRTHDAWVASATG